MAPLQRKLARYQLRAKPRRSRGNTRPKFASLAKAVFLANGLETDPVPRGETDAGVVAAATVTMAIATLGTGVRVHAPPPEPALAVTHVGSFEASQLRLRDIGQAIAAVPKQQLALRFAKHGDAASVPHALGGPCGVASLVTADGCTLTLAVNTTARTSTAAGACVGRGHVTHIDGVAAASVPIMDVWRGLQTDLLFALLDAPPKPSPHSATAAAAATTTATITATTNSSATAAETTVTRSVRAPPRTPGATQPEQDAPNQQSSALQNPGTYPTSIAGRKDRLQAHQAQARRSPRPSRKGIGPKLVTTL